VVIQHVSRFNLNKRFMKSAHIPPYDELTQSHMIVNRIAHWSFFLMAMEAQLTTKGFPLGTARLLCNAAAKIGPIVNKNGPSNWAEVTIELIWKPISAPATYPLRIT
jgi:hypothetical protein